eukprot:20352-Heterococcus_DN1.PRE.6
MVSVVATTAVCKLDSEGATPATAYHAQQSTCCDAPAACTEYQALCADHRLSKQCNSRAATALCAT